MAEIVANSSKYRISGKLYHPLKYADLEACFADRGPETIYLEAWFRDEQFKDGRYRLVNIAHYPDRPVAGLHLDNTRPWYGVADAVVVNADVSAVPRKLDVAARLTRARLREIVVGQVRQLTPRGWPGNRWALNIYWLPEDGQVECVRRKWNGLRLDQEEKELIMLQEENPPEAG